MSDFEGKVAIVTGAGGGLGRCHALAFAERGAKVVVNDLGGGVHGDGASDMADVVVEEITAAGGVAIANKASVSDRDGAKSIVDDAVAAFGSVDIVVNNAAIAMGGHDIPLGDLEAFTPEIWDQMMSINVRGPYLVTRAAAAHLRASNWGQVVNIGSTKVMATGMQTGRLRPAKPPSSRSLDSSRPRLLRMCG